MAICPAFKTLREEDLEFSTNLGYIPGPCFKKKTKDS
jgi:hypothetical protein